jgi:hypothetical protein
VCSVLHPYSVCSVFTPYSVCSVFHPFAALCCFARILPLATVLNCPQSMSSALYCMMVLIPPYPKCYTLAFPRVAGRTFNYKCFTYPRNN